MPHRRHRRTTARRAGSRIYVDVAEDLQRGAVDKLGFLFEQAGE